ncbi:hypothetical protein GCM10022255_096660 [Dactylosporangium darangshiense]|uniref:META domain-containing protein n=1 Tax=Dactylosporangium darangshiense TaxID=579108 RepID=A0ABP8DQT9_9ACTN
MPFDERVREGLHRAAASIEPDVERSLHRITAGRRRSRVYRPLMIAAGGLATLLLIAGVPVLQRLLSAGSPEGVAGGGTLAGRYETTLRASQVAAVDTALAGTWRLQLRPDGTVVLDPPEALQAPHGPVCGEVGSPCRYDADAGTFRTNLEPGTPGAACNSLGTYTWRLHGGRLTLHTVSDPCAARRTLLAASEWTDLADPRLPEGAYRTGALSLDQLRLAGAAAGLDQAGVEDFWRGEGVTRTVELTLRLDAGQWTVLVSADGRPDVQAWTGWYAIEDDLTVRTTEAATSCAQATYRYRLDGDTLRLAGASRECDGRAGVIRLTALHQSAPFIRQHG